MDSGFEITAESWVMSAHRDGKSLVAAGEDTDAGIPFDEYLKTRSSEILGWKSLPYERFPILVKFIDAAKSLSVQVHPADAYALEHENDYGKNEMWYVLDAKEGAYIYLGFEEDTTPAEVKERIAAGNLTEILHKVYVKKGDSVMVPAGMIHAIGDGILILEVQQSSNATYRLYDYNRVGADGKKRALHLDKALANMDYSACRIKAGSSGAREDMKGYSKLLLQQCKYFSVTKLSVRDEAELVMDRSTFYSLVALEGTGVIETEIIKDGIRQDMTSLSFKPGDSFFLPAESKIVRISGRCEFILSHI